MSTPSRKRLMRDFKRLQQDPPAGISGAPHDNNIMVWNAVIFGPDDTPWDGGTFKLTLQFSEDYPNKPPTVRFVSRMFHPNIYADGSICLDILQNQWSPIYDVAAILTSIQKDFNHLAMFFPWILISHKASTALGSTWEQRVFLLLTISGGKSCNCIPLSQNFNNSVGSEESLLCDPNPNSPANAEAARMFSENKREYNRRVRESVEQSWTAD
ncbi:hypothetical protein Lal_00030238 [Lupinus albus]|nr:hypothetical protein Lal_00030238 [Lupinus albus]